MERYDYFKIRYKIDMFHNDYAYLHDFNDGMAIFEKKDGTKNVMDKFGNIGIPGASFKSYDNLIYYKDGVAIFVKSNVFNSKLLEFIDLEGNIINSVECDTYILENKFITVRYFNRYGVISYDGKVVIPCKYPFELKFSEGLCVASKDISNGGVLPVKGKYGYLNESGEMVIPFIYDKAFPFTDGLALVFKDNYSAYINKEGQVELLCFNNEYYPFSDGLAVVYRNNRYGYIDKKGNEVIPCIYKMAQSFNDGLAVVKNDSAMYGCINKKGEVVVPFKYDNIYRWENGYCTLKGKKHGWLDNEGKEIIPCIYDNTICFREGKARAYKHGRYGYIDTNGEVIIPFIYKNTADFKEGMAQVYKEYGMGFINEKNETIIVEEERYISGANDIPECAFDVEITEYISVFNIADKVIYVKARDLKAYEKKVKIVEDALRIDNLADIYQEVLIRAKKV